MLGNEITAFDPRLGCEWRAKRRRLNSLRRRRDLPPMFRAHEMEELRAWLRRRGCENFAPAIQQWMDRADERLRDREEMRLDRVRALEEEIPPQERKLRRRSLLREQRLDERIRSLPAPKPLSVAERLLHHIKIIDTRVQENAEDEAARNILAVLSAWADALK
jgi:hypothetical protein